MCMHHTEWFMGDFNSQILPNQSKNLKKSQVDLFHNDTLARTQSWVSAEFDSKVTFLKGKKWSINLTSQYESQLLLVDL